MAGLIASSSCTRADDALLVEQLRSEGPMNLARAYEVMERFDLAGLVLAEPVNVFHLLGYWPQLANTRMGQPPTTFALLSRDARQAPGLVASRFIYYYTFVDGAGERPLQVYLYREADDAGDPAADDAGAPGIDASIANAIGEFPDRGLAPLSPLEIRRRAALDAASAARATRADAGAALAGAMRDMGLWRGRVACDHPLTRAICERRDHPGELVPADNVLRWIRIIKSPLEIRLMTRAAAGNVAAVHALGRHIRAGATHAELRHVFEVEAARAGNRALFLNVDRASSPLADGVVADGQAFFIDGVSHFHHYHGDYARMVFVGEPAASARTAARAVAHAWNAVREQLRPGLRYAEIAAMGQRAVRRGGFDLSIGFGPHSVGLMHTDEPGSDRGGFYGKLDLELQPNMVLSVDCPVLDTGIGGSAHIEDLLLITADGAEPIHAIGAEVITV